MNPELPLRCRSYLNNDSSRNHIMIMYWEWYRYLFNRFTIFNQIMRFSFLFTILIDIYAYLFLRFMISQLPSYLFFLYLVVPNLYWRNLTFQENFLVCLHNISPSFSHAFLSDHTKDVMATAAFEYYFFGHRLFEER